MMGFKRGVKSVIPVTNITAIQQGQLTGCILHFGTLAVTFEFEFCHSEPPMPMG
jgi:hypothetical protein